MRNPLLQFIIYLQLYIASASAYDENIKANTGAKFLLFPKSDNSQPDLNTTILRQSPF